MDIISFNKAIMVGKKATADIAVVEDKVAELNSNTLKLGEAGVEFDPVLPTDPANKNYVDNMAIVAGGEVPITKVYSQTAEADQTDFFWTEPISQVTRLAVDELLNDYTYTVTVDTVAVSFTSDSEATISEVKNGITSGSIWHYESVGHTHFNNEELAKLLGKGIFENPKGTKLINRMMKLSTSKNDIILDFFAGSGTTAHAVMKLNAEDGGNRKFILVQIPEETPPKSEAKKAGYDTIFSITQERINRAGDKIIKDDLTLQDLDIGFRTFDIVDDKQQKIYQKSLQSVTQDDLLAFTENSVDSIEDILYNLLVAESLPLSSKIDTLIKDKLYFSLNSAFVLGDISIDELIDTLKIKKELEYITIYSPNINSDKFTLELESAVGNLGLKRDKLRFRG